VFLSDSRATTSDWTIEGGGTVHATFFTCPPGLRGPYDRLDEIGETVSPIPSFERVFPLKSLNDEHIFL